MICLSCPCRPVRIKCNMQLLINRSTTHGPLLFCRQPVILYRKTSKGNGKWLPLGQPLQRPWKKLFFFSGLTHSGHHTACSIKVFEVLLDWKSSIYGAGWDSFHNICLIHEKFSTTSQSCQTFITPHQKKKKKASKPEVNVLPLVLHFCWDIKKIHKHILPYFAFFFFAYHALQT